MENAEARKLILEAQLAETSRLGDAIAERHAAAERFISVAGALAGVGLTLGLREEQKPILIGLPIGLAVIILYMIQIYTDAGMHSGHRRALELQLEKVFGQTVLVGQSRVAALHARRRSVVYAPALILAVWIGTFVFGINAVLTWEAIKGPWNVAYFWLYLCLTVGALAVIGQALRENIAAEKTAEGLAREAWPETAEP